MAQLTGYEPQELVDKTLYQYVHAGDILHLRYSHQMCKCIFRIYVFVFGWDLLNIMRVLCVWKMGVM